MGVDTMKKYFPIFVASLFVLILFGLLFKISSDTDANKYIRAIGYPKDTIQKENGCEAIVIEMHDFANDTIYLDTIERHSRMPSTLEEFEPKYRRFRQRDYCK